MKLYRHSTGVVAIGLWLGTLLEIHSLTGVLGAKPWQLARVAGGLMVAFPLAVVFSAMWWRERRGAERKAMKGEHVS